MNFSPWIIPLWSNIQNENQDHQNILDNGLLQERLFIRYGEHVVGQESQDDSFYNSGQDYIDLNSSNNYRDIEILQQLRCGTTERDSEFILKESSNVPPISSQNNFESYSNVRSEYVSEERSRQNRIGNKARNRNGKKPYYRINANKDRKNGRSNKDYYSYQEEILNSFLLFPIAADKLNEVIIKNYAGVMELKKGLCLEWIQTETCDSENCAWSHEPRVLFEKRLHSLPNLEMINILLCMQDDQFYLEALLEGFEELIKRDVPEKWIQILIFYIFTKTESLFFSFFEFWCRIAEYFCVKKKFDNSLLGFIELLKLFANVKLEDRWRVFRFIEMLKSSSSEIKITYQFLKPILDFDISPKLLIEAVESCSEAKVNLKEIYREIIPKINVQYLPLDGVEALLKYSEVLTASYSSILAKNLKTSLARKIESLPPNADKNEYPLTAKYLRTLSGATDEEDEIIYEELITNVLQELTTKFDFQYLTLKINEINENFAERAGEAIIKAIISMEFSAHDIMDLLDIMIFNGKTKSAEKITASLALTLIHDYVKVDDWKMAYSVLEICDNKKINLLHSKIIGSDPKNSMEEYKLVFLLSEIYLNNEKWEEFVIHLERYFILSPSRTNWTIVQTPEAKKLKAQIIDNFFKMTFSKDIIDEPYLLFDMIKKCQRKSTYPIDLRSYANDIIVGLSNKKKEAVKSLAEEFWSTCLKPITIRSLLIYMVQEKLVEDANKYFVGIANKIYKFPKDMLPDPDSIFRITVESTWSEEELFLFFDHFFYKLMRFSFKPSSISSISPNCLKANISIQLSSLEHDLNVKPWSLMEIDNSEDAIKRRLQSVLENKMVPPLKTFSVSKVIFIEAESLYQHVRALFSKFKNL